MSNTTVRAGGPGLLTLLTVLFVGLKLGGVITWSWWWVLSPTLIPLGLTLCVLIVALFVVIGLACFGK